jgi:hypothetical protein
VLVPIPIVDDLPLRQMGIDMTRRRTLLTAAAVGVTAAIGFPAAWLLRDRLGGQAGESAVAEPLARGDNLRLPIRLRPTWLPDDVIELSREAWTSTGEQSRAWASPAGIAAQRAGDPEGAARNPFVSVRLAPKPQPIAYPSPWPSESPPPTDPVDPLGAAPNTTIGGRPAVLREGEVSWQLDDGMVVNVATSRTAPRDQVLRIAESLVDDSTVGCETSLRLGWTPVAVPSLIVDVTGWDGGWVQEIRTDQLIADLATNAALLGDRAIHDGDSITLRGRPGRATSQDGYGHAAVELDNGRWLATLCYLGGSPQEKQANAVRMADELTIGPDPYLDWIGRR